MANIIAKPNATLTSVIPMASTHVHKGINMKKPTAIIISPMHPIAVPLLFCVSLSGFLHIEK